MLNRALPIYALCKARMRQIRPQRTPVAMTYSYKIAQTNPIDDPRIRRKWINLRPAPDWRARAGLPQITRPAATNTATRARPVDLHAGHGALFTGPSHNTRPAASSTGVQRLVRARTGPNRYWPPPGVGAVFCSRLGRRRPRHVIHGSVTEHGTGRNKCGAPCRPARRPRRAINGPTTTERSGRCFKSSSSGGRDRAYKYECGAGNRASVL